MKLAVNHDLVNRMQQKNENKELPMILIKNSKYFFYCLGGWTIGDLALGGQVETGLVLGAVLGTIVYVMKVIANINR